MIKDLDLYIFTALISLGHLKITVVFLLLFFFLFKTKPRNKNKITDAAQRVLSLGIFGGFH